MGELLNGNTPVDSATKSDSASNTGTTVFSAKHLLASGGSAAGIAAIVALVVANSAGTATTVGQVTAVATTTTAAHESSAVALSTRVDGGALAEALRATPNGGLAVGTTTDPGAGALRVAGIAQLAGGMRLATTTLTSGSTWPYTATSSDLVILVADTTSARTVNLPCNATAGTTWFVIDASPSGAGDAGSSAHAITVGASSGAVLGPPGATTIQIDQDLRAFVSDGTNCREL